MFRLTNLRVGLGLLVAVAVTTLGCRNPFNPSSDIELAHISPEVNIYQAQLPSGSGALIISQWEVEATFVIKNKVAATVTSVNVEYMDYSGNPVTVYKGTGGKSFKTTYRILPMNDDNNANNYPNNLGEGHGTQFPLFIVDRQVVNEITAPGYPADRFMVALLTFRGEDDNGYDFKLTAKIGIKYYP